jgi:hypothetical protein
MLRRSAVLVLVLGVIAFAGCSTRPISVAEAVVTEFVQPDGVLSSFIWFGPDSPEYADAWEHFESHARTYENDLRDIHDLWDKHFLRYDRHDPFSE